MGGADPSNETCKTIRAIRMLNKPDIITDVVIGISNPHLNEIETMVSQIHHINCHTNVENIAELMNAADLGIGAGGITTWERCCLGLPSIVITIAENQINSIESLGRRGVVINLGWHKEVTENHIKNALEDLISNSEKRKNMSFKGKDMVDGHGAERVVEGISKIAV